ncbi:MAG TPA: hypothetical protein VIT00_09420, partial [Terrimicrobiaceae bacterium]
MYQVKERKLRFTLPDNVAAMRTSVGVLGYLAATFLALHHRHRAYWDNRFEYWSSQDATGP